MFYLAVGLEMVKEEYFFYACEKSFMQTSEGGMFIHFSANADKLAFHANLLVYPSSLWQQGAFFHGKCAK